MGHSVIKCENCGSHVMEGRNNWECDCGWTYPEYIKVMKPVWRMNTGNGVPSDLGDELMYDDGHILPASAWDRCSTAIWEFDNYDFNILYYQTTDTREAKR